MRAVGVDGGENGGGGDGEGAAAPRDSQPGELLDHAIAAPDWETAMPRVDALLATPSAAAFEVAARRTRSGSGWAREVAAITLGQLANRLGSPPHTDRAVVLLTGLLDGADDPGMIATLVDALPWGCDARALARLLRLRTHPDDTVRYEVAKALPTTMDTADPAPAGVAALVALTTDPDDDVRDWGTFGLGTMLKVDTPEVRAALAARLDDPHFDTACEALVGLARRGDRRALPYVLRALTGGDDGVVDVSRLQVEAAAELADPVLHEHLVDLRRWWDVDPELLERAIERCTPPS